MEEVGRLIKKEKKTRWAELDTHAHTHTHSQQGR